VFSTKAFVFLGQFLVLFGNNVRVTIGSDPLAQGGHSNPNLLGDVNITCQAMDQTMPVDGSTHWSVQSALRRV